MPLTKNAEDAPVTMNDFPLTGNGTMKTKISCNVAWPMECSLGLLWAGVLDDNTAVFAMIDRPSNSQWQGCQETRNDKPHINRLKSHDQ